MASKKKPMTKAEKKFRSQIKKDMQERGILSPDKPKLNRKNILKKLEMSGTKKIMNAMFGNYICMKQYV